MGQFQHRWLNIWGRMLLGVWTVGCLFSCSLGDDLEDSTVVNDTFTARYHIKGKVIDTVTKEKLAGMRIVSGITRGSKKGLASRDTVYTDANGEFNQEYYGEAVETYRFIWEDSKNAEYTKDSLEIPVIGQLTNGQGWYLGETSLSVTLEAKKKY